MLKDIKDLVDGNQKKVKFRCGGEAIVTGWALVSKLTSDKTWFVDTDVKLKFNGGSCEVVYTEDGLARHLPAIFDIVEVADV